MLSSSRIKHPMPVQQALTVHFLRFFHHAIPWAWTPNHLKAEPSSQPKQSIIINMQEQHRRLSTSHQIFLKKITDRIFSHEIDQSPLAEIFKNLLVDPSSSAAWQSAPYPHRLKIHRNIKPYHSSNTPHNLSSFDWHTRLLSWPRQLHWVIAQGILPRKWYQ